jgi:uncharacterized membrane protein
VAIAGVLSAVTVVLGVTHLGLIPWFSGASVTVMHVPVIVGALLEGPVVGVAVGLIFGLYSLFQAAAAPTGPIDVAFVNPLVSVLPRLLIGPAAWLVYRALRGSGSAAREGTAVAVSGVVGSLANTVLVLSALSLFGFIPWSVAGGVAVANGLPEAAVAGLVVFVVVSAWKRIPSAKATAKLAEEEEE